MKPIAVLLLLLIPAFTFAQDHAPVKEAPAVVRVEKPCNVGCRVKRMLVKTRHGLRVTGYWLAREWVKAN